MRKVEWSAIGVIMAWVVILLLAALSYRPSDAQEDTPHVITVFEQGCIEGLDEYHYRLHYSYTSDGVELYTFAMGEVVRSNLGTAPYTGHATSNTPLFFDTSKGYHDEWYLEGQSEDSPYTFHLLLTDDIGTADLPLNTWDAPRWCEAGEYLPQATPPQNAAKALVALNSPMPIVGVGRTCVIQYPKIILVCVP